MPNRQLLFITIFILGLLTPLFLSDLLPVSLVLGTFVLPLVGFLFRARVVRQLAAVALTFLVAFALSSLQIYQRVAHQLDPNLEGRDVWLQGTIIHRPHKTEAGATYAASEDKSSKIEEHFYRFEMTVEKLQVVRDGKLHSIDQLMGGKVRLSWRLPTSHTPTLSAGQTWRLLVRLKRPRGFVNPKGFDYQAWLLAKNIMASGYVKQPSSEEHSFVSAQPSGVFESTRAVLRQRLFEPNQHPLTGIVQALLIGDRSDISKEQWNVFRDTGTSHLMAISGLHVGIISVFGFLFGRKIICPLTVFCFPALRVITAQIFIYLPAVLSIFLAAVYAGVSGFSVPTQRAWLMIVLANVALMLSRRCDGIYLLLCVAAFVLAANPLVAAQTGFWLSFAAVFFLLYSFAYETGRGRTWLDLFNAQAVVFVGLVAVLSALSIPVSLVSPLANIIAVPLMSLLVIPVLFIAALTSLFSVTLGSFFLQCALLACELLWRFLMLLSTFNQSHFIANEILFVAFGVLASLMILSIGSLQLRLIGLGIALVFVLGRSSSGANLELVVLDVGQGLSVVLRSPDATWVYDTGARFSQDFDIGSAVLVPYLKSHGTDSLDYVVVSHGDNDHAGGLASLTKGMAIKRFIFNHDHTQVRDRELCYQGKVWQIGESTVEALWPPANAQDQTKDNNESCVLLVRNHGFTALLSGDIEKSVERQLLSDNILPRNIDLLIAPHHGSRSSSSPEFLAHLSPSHVIFSAGYKNRYGHPAEDVVDRYVRLGTHIWRTDLNGAITVRVEKNNRPTLRSQRSDSMRPWLVVP